MKLIDKIKLGITYVLQGIGLAIPVVIIVKLITQPKEAVMISIGIILFVVGKKLRDKMSGTVTVDYNLMRLE